MASTRKGIFARNIFSNIAGYMVSAAVALFLTKYVQEGFTRLDYGLWQILIALTGYYTLLDLGVRSAVGQYVTRYLAKGDIAGVNRTLNTALQLLVGVALFAFVVTIALTLTLPLWLPDDMPESHTSKAQWALLIIGTGVAASLPMALFSSVPYAKERFDILNAVLIGECLLRAVLAILVLALGGGVRSLAVAVTIAQLAAWFARVSAARRLVPELRIRLGTFDRSSARELGSFGIYNFLVNAADRIVLHTDAIVVAVFLHVHVVPYYTNGSLLIPFYTQLVLMVTWTITPYATACDARGDHAALRRLLLHGTRVSVFLATVIGVGLLCAGSEFLHLYLPEENLVHPDYHTSGEVLAILTVASLARSSSSCGRQILFGMRRMRVLAAMSLAEALLNLGFTLVLVHSFDLAGVAFGTLIPVVLVYGIAQNLMIVRLVDAGALEYSFQLVRAALPVAAGMGLVAMWTAGWLVADTWGWFAVKVILLLIPVAPIGYFVVMNEDERRMVRERLRPGSSPA